MSQSILKMQLGINEYIKDLTIVTAEKERIGTDRMLALLNKYKNVPINELLIKLRNDIDKFAGDTPQFDDITMLSIKYKGVQTE